MTDQLPPKHLIVTDQQYRNGWYENRNGEVILHKEWPIISKRLDDYRWEVINPAYWVRMVEQHELIQAARKGEGE